MALGHGSFSKVKTALAFECQLIVSPYSDVSTHMHSLAHPVFHAVQFGIDILKLLGGVVQLIVSPLSLSGYVMADRFVGVVKSVLAIALDVVACAISVISIVTRSLASLGGYKNSGFRGHECSGRNEETTMNMLGAMGAGIFAQVDARNCAYALPSFSTPDNLFRGF